MLYLVFTAIDYAGGIFANFLSMQANDQQQNERAPNDASNFWVFISCINFR